MERLAYAQAAQDADKEILRQPLEDDEEVIGNSSHSNNHSKVVLLTSSSGEGYALSRGGYTVQKFVPVVSLLALLSAGAAAQDRDDWGKSHIQHVLLVSIDGMHAVDFQNCAHGIAGANNGSPYCPNLAALATTGVNYAAANTSKPSDSFPGLMNIVTGATPRTMGVYYDVAYASRREPRVR